MSSRTWLHRAPDGDSQKLERIEPATYRATAKVLSNKHWYLIDTGSDTGWVKENVTDADC